MEIFIYYLAAVNAVAFLMFGVDKRRAVKHQWRISEAALMTVTVLGGGAGALLGMRYFRHKTKKPKFYLGVPGILIAETVVVYFCFKY